MAFDSLPINSIDSSPISGIDSLPINSIDSSPISGIDPLSTKSINTFPIKSIDTLFINGTVGSGKTTVAAAICGLEAADGRSHAVIDLDDIRRAWPSPPEDHFHHELELTNLRDLARNYRAAGTVHLVLAGVIEQAAEIPRYAEALGSTGLFIGRLTVDPAIGAERLRRRHADDAEGRAWSLNRMPELAGILERADLDHRVFDTSARSPLDIAADIRRAAGWAA